MAAVTALRQKRARPVLTIPMIMRQGRTLPLLYLAPALVIVFVFIVYPSLNTIYLSFRNATGTGWADTACVAGQPCWGIFENFRYSLTSDVMVTAFYNSLKWIFIMVPGCVLGGLIIATLANQVRYEALARAIIFFPMAISLVGVGVIFKFVYDYAAGPTQIGLLNAIISSLGGKPVAWLSVPQVNTIALSSAGVWMWTGFCTTLLTIAVKDVPSEIIDAAKADGATEWLIFQHVTLPHITPTLIVVITTMIINVLKIFDIVYITTSGNYGTEVIANRMYIEQYNTAQSGRAAAIAVVLIILIIPAMIYNIRFYYQQEASR